MPQRNHTGDGNGPNVKVRGDAHQIFQRYMDRGRQAAIEGDRVAAENFYQHAEHYFRIANPNPADNRREAVQPTNSAAAVPGARWATTGEAML
jgi:hypothetical protein